MKPTVAIIGRPNTGKSTLFNRLAGQRIAIVDDTPGVTRDRIYADCVWNGREITLIDTAGIEPKMEGEILSEMRSQVDIALTTADVIVFVCDVKVGVTADDEYISHMLKRSKKPIILAVNKCDNIGDLPPQFYEFYNLALGDPIAVSAIHGKGTGDLLDAIIEKCPKNVQEAEEEELIKIAVVGKPNSGKSSLVNKILGENRMIVSSIAGTTRDSVDSLAIYAGEEYVLVDTAGMRKKAKVDNDIERYSVMRSLDAIDRADVTLILIDGVEGVSEQDSKIIGYAHDNAKPIVIAVNKWDIVEKDDKTQNKFRNEIAKEFPFADYAPIIFISAKTGQRINEIFENVNFVYQQARMRVPTSALNEIIGEAVMRTQPPSFKGKRLKIYYSTQQGVCPPTFVLFVNDPHLLHFSYERYLENQIRDNFNFKGTIIKIITKGKKES